MEFKTLLYGKYSEIGMIALRNPGSINVINNELISELSAIIDVISMDDRVKSVLINGGSGIFAADWDIPFIADADPVRAEKYMESVISVLNKIEHLDKPVVAALNGNVLGGGAELALACDVRIASESMQMGLAEINLGIIPGAGGTQRLARIAGPAWTKYIIMTGSYIDAWTALRTGLVTSVVPDDRLSDEAKKTAKAIALRSAVAMKAAKKCLNYGMNVNLPSGLIYEFKSWASLFSTEDQKEGMKAFIERRKPVFKDR